MTLVASRIVVSLRFFDTSDLGGSLPGDVVGAERRIRLWWHMVPTFLPTASKVQVGLLEIAITFQYLRFDLLYMRFYRVLDSWNRQLHV